MLHVRAGRDVMDLFDRCSVLVFYTAAVFALIHPCRGQSEVIGPLHPVVAWIGDDIILPCNLDPVMDALDMAVEWARPDLNPRFVFVWRDGVELESKKHPSYTNRTSVFTDELKNGNMSLKISKVKLSDEGTYRCFFPELNKDTTVQLVVGAVSSPVISFAGLNKTISGVVLQCECAGWYPEPELLWLDSEGNLLSAGPTETLRGPDDLYTVSSRVTVEKRHSNNITCRVQQKKISQSRETHRHVPDDFFLVSPSGPPSRPISNPNVTVASAVSVAVVLLLIGAVFFVWKWRRGKFKKKKSEEDGAEQARKKNTISSKNSGMPVVEEQSKPLMTGREEDDDVDSREDQRHEDDRETKQDEFVLETEQIKNINSPQEKRINPSTVNDKESLIKMEHKTQDMTGREEKGDVNNSGKKKRQKKMVMKKPKKKQSKEVDTDSSETKTSAVTKTEPQFKMKQETHEEQSRRGRHETHNVDIREQRNKDGETQQNQPVTETVQTRDTDRPEEKRINPLTVSDEESLVTVEQKTQDMTGREEKEKETQQNDHDKKQKQKETEQRSNTDSPGTKTSAVTVNEPQFEEQSRRGRHETHNVDTRELRNKDDIKTQRTGRDRINQFIMTEKVSQSTTDQETDEEKEMPGRGMKAEVAESERKKKMQAGKTDLRCQFSPFTEEHKEEPMLLGEAKSFNFSFHLSSDQEPRREKERQQEQLVEKRQMERNVDMKESETEKKRAEENSGEVNKVNSVFMPQKETQREKLEAEQQREENQRKLQPETRREREKDEKELKIRKDNKNQPEEQRGQTESMISSVQVPLDTHLKIQGQNHKKQPEETCQQSPEQIREQPEKLRGAERKEGAQGKELEVNEGLRSEETKKKDKEREKLQLPHEGELQAEQQVNVNEKQQLEESVSLTERVVCVEEKQEEEPMQRTCDFDQKNNQSRHRPNALKLNEVCTLPVKKQKFEEERRPRKHQNFKKPKKYVKKQNDYHMNVDDAAHSQYAATSQSYEPMQWTKDQQMLPVQTEPQECLKENDENQQDQMEVD
uniref:Ig-like domain-containing protein n=3 Tax=Astatotilapia calliptera TaxID=8154 RepID=A0A3P8NPD4_ASTCA